MAILLVRGPSSTRDISAFCSDSSSHSTHVGEEVVAGVGEEVGAGVGEEVGADFDREHCCPLHQCAPYPTLLMMMT